MTRFLTFTLLLLPILLHAASDVTRSRERPGYEEITDERIAALPVEERAAWSAYLEQSRALAAADLAALAAERASSPSPLPAGADAAPWRINASRPVAWYAGSEARELAERVVSYQTPAGGWNKANPYVRRRAPGEEFGRERRYRGTFDNGATVSELRFLARVITALPRSDAVPLIALFERGLAYVFAAQFPNSGWPQVYPLTGDYHDALTFNDDAMVNLLTLLRDVSAGQDTFAFVPPGTREAAAATIERGVACIIRAQVKRAGRPTGWGQQHDALTLEPCAARAYEMASLCTSESAGLARYLLNIPSPGPDLVASIEGAAAWFESTAIRDMAYRDLEGTGRRLVPEAGAGPLWARMIGLTTHRPIFGDRDYTVHATVDTISTERRRGYAWYTDRPEKALKEIVRWRELRNASGNGR